MDAEDFAIWRESTGTQWVMSRLAAIADRVEEGIKQRMIDSLLTDPATWAALQARFADDKGYVRAIREMILLEFDDVTTGTTDEHS